MSRCFFFQGWTDRQTVSQPHAIREELRWKLLCSGFSGFMQPDFALLELDDVLLYKIFFVLACDDNMNGKLQNVVSTKYSKRLYKSCQ
jgi:hypothetical protein